MSFLFDLHSVAVSDSHLPSHAPNMPFFSRPQHSTTVERRPCCAVALRRKACSEHGLASVNQTRPHCVNQMGKTHSKPLAARHGRGTAWARHAMCESAFIELSLYRPYSFMSVINIEVKRSPCHILSTYDYFKADRTVFRKKENNQTSSYGFRQKNRLKCNTLLAQMWK